MKKEDETGGREERSDRWKQEEEKEESIYIAL